MQHNIIWTDECICASIRLYSIHTILCAWWSSSLNARCTSMLRRKRTTLRSNRKTWAKSFAKGKCGYTRNRKWLSCVYIMAIVIVFFTPWVVVIILLDVQMRVVQSSRVSEFESEIERCLITIHPVTLICGLSHPDRNYTFQWYDVQVV